MPGDKEKLVALQKQKEDIEMLLSSLEEAYNDASLSEEHYNEVKQKNQKKLEEINAEITKLGEKVGKVESSAEPTSAPAEKPPAEAPAEKPKKKKGKKKSKKAKESAEAPAKKPKKKKEEIVDEDLPIIPVSQAGPGEGLGGDEIGGAPAAESTPVATTPPELDKKKLSSDAAAVGTKLDTSEIKDVITRLVEQIKPSGIEVLPKVEKMQVQLEKLKAFIEAVKDEKKGNADTIRRIMEEMGEIRSNVASSDGRLSDAAMKVDDMTETLKMLKPERFTKLLTKLDSSIKQNEAKIEKLDDISSVVIKKVGLVEDVLREMGSLEKIVSFSKNIASRMIMVDQTEKRITRVGDKIDGIFVEINKRLEDFMLYKAKQDTSDELIQEMMKNMDEIDTKISGLVTKEELEEMRDNLETRISSAAETAGVKASPAIAKYNEQKEEINSVLEMMEEQFKSGALKKDEYEKAKKINTERLVGIEKKIAEEKSTGGGMTDAPAPGTEPEAPVSTTVSPETAPVEGAPTAPEMAEEPTKIAEQTESEGTEGESQEEELAEKDKPEEVVKEPEIAESPEKEKTKDEPKKEEPKLSKKEIMLKELEESFKSGLISKEAYEKTKKLLGE